MLTGCSSVEDAVAKCFESPKMEILVLKNGSKGSRIYTREGVEEVGVYPVTQVDATGAGDCFDGAFLAGLAQGKPLVEAARMGSAAGALNVSAFGPMEGKISPENVAAMIAGTWKQ